MLPTDNPEVQKVIAEGRALSLALNVIEGDTDADEARRATQRVYDRCDPDSLSDWVQAFAACRILGLKFRGLVAALLTTEDLIEDPQERDLFEATAYAWIIWASKTPDNSGYLHRLQAARESFQEREGLLHQLALGYWAGAVEQLFLGDDGEARRLFRRTADVGGQLGTETNPVIQWTFAATFFPQT